MCSARQKVYSLAQENLIWEKVIQHLPMYPCISFIY